jgi:3-phosphoshikimate 1-carboxyvinyltransferase
LHWTLPVASAQIKSALLLAGAIGGVSVNLTEPGVSRDHTERLLRHFGFELTHAGLELQLQPTGAFRPFTMQVPGDPSSAAFLVAATLLAGEGEIRITSVGLNPTRMGFLAVLVRMGAAVDILPGEESLGEPCGDLVARPAGLTATTVTAGEVPGVIDEIPVLAILAARAEGTTVFHGLGELRVKESDRLTLLASNLTAVGAQAEVRGDDLLVTGSEARYEGRVVTAGDHRIAMAFAVLGTQPGARIHVDDPDCAAVSFPRFADCLAALFMGGR